MLWCYVMLCRNGKGRQVDEPFDGGHGIGIDTVTIHQIDSLDEKGWEQKWGSEEPLQSK